MLNKKLNFAAIDIGSNAVRFLIKSVAEGEPPSAMTKTVLIRIPLRLGEDSFRRGVITTFKENNDAHGQGVPSADESIRGDGLPGLRDLGHARRVERRANRP